MFEPDITELIIVCDEKTVGYANYLRQLVSTNDDEEEVVVGTKDGAIEVVVWLEKDYLANMPIITSAQHVLFIGENQTSKNEISSMNVKFDKFGMKYGWLGKRGMMLVSDVISQPEMYDEFVEFCRSYKSDFEKIEFSKSIPEQAFDAVNGVVGGNAAALIAGGALLGFLAPGITLATGAVLGVTQFLTGTDREKVMDQQYRGLTAILYMDGLSEFLEG
mgnify:CR=1 FL=1